MFFLDVRNLLNGGAVPDAWELHMLEDVVIVLFRVLARSFYDVLNSVRAYFRTILYRRAYNVDLTSVLPIAILLLWFACWVSH